MHGFFLTLLSSSTALLPLRRRQCLYGRLSLSTQCDSVCLSLSLCLSCACRACTYVAKARTGGIGRRFSAAHVLCFSIVDYSATETSLEMFRAEITSMVFPRFRGSCFLAVCRRYMTRVRNLCDKSCEFVFTNWLRLHLRKPKSAICAQNSPNMSQTVRSLYMTDAAGER